MIRVALLGSDSTHVEAFSSLLNGPGAELGAQGRVVALWGEDAAQAAEKAARLGIERVAGTPEEALEGVDLAMVTGRFADSHAGPASLALEHGVPTFVDKPFTDTADSARTLVALARERGTPLCSASPLRFARETREVAAFVEAQDGPVTVVATAPATCTDLGDDPRLHSAMFYGIHSVEILLEILGPGRWEVDIAYGRDVVTARLESPGGRSGVLSLVRETPELYGLDAYGPGGSCRREVTLDGHYYRDELAFLLQRFAGAGAGEGIDLDGTVQGIALLETIDHDDRHRGAPAT